MKSEEARQIGKVKSIEDMARDYQRSDQSDGTTATAFENGASWMRTELTVWNDPKIQLPTHDKEVLCITDRTRNTYAVLRYKDCRWYQWSLRQKIGVVTMELYWVGARFT